MICKLCGSQSEARICRSCLAYYAFSCDHCAKYSLCVENHQCEEKEGEDIPFDRKCSFNDCCYHSQVGEWFEPDARTCPSHSVD